MSRRELRVVLASGLAAMGFAALLGAAPSALAEPAQPTTPSAPGGPAATSTTDELTDMVLDAIQNRPAAPPAQ